MNYKKMKFASCIVFNNYNLAVKKERDKWHKAPLASDCFSFSSRKSLILAVHKQGQQSLRTTIF